MDSSSGQTLHPSLNKKVKVLIGSIREELKLVVKIDKTLVRLPPKHNNSYHKVSAGSLIPKTSDSILLNPGSVDSNWKHPPYICRPVDSTFLFDLGRYVDQDSIGSRRGHGIGKTIRRKRTSANHSRKPSSAATSKNIRNLFLKRERVNSMWDQWKIQHRDLNIFDTPKSQGEPVQTDCLSTTMEHAVLNRDIKEYNLTLKKGADFTRMVVASAVQNNNRLKVGDEMDQHLLLPVDERGSMTTGRLHVEAVRGEDEGVSRTDSDDAHDQTVPQLPAAGQKVQSADSSREKNIDTGVNCSDRVREGSHDMSSRLPESKESEFNPQTKDTRLNGHYTPGSLSFERALKTPSWQTGSASVSIGEQVDEEIKALLDDVNSECSPSTVAGNTEEPHVPNGHSTPSPAAVKKTQTMNTVNGIPPQSEPIQTDGNVGGKSICEGGKTGNRGDMSETSIRKTPSLSPEFEDSLVTGASQRPNGHFACATPEPISNSVSVDMGNMYPNTKVTYSKDKAVRDNEEFEDPDLADSCASSSTSPSRNDSKIIPCHPEEQCVVKDNLHMSPHVSPPEEAQIDKMSSEDEAAGIVDDNFVRKGLKQQQWESLLEAEVTSEYMEASSSLRHPVAEVLPQFEVAVPTVERSGSVIVSNPRSLLQDKSQTPLPGGTFDLRAVKSEVMSEDDASSDVPGEALPAEVVSSNVEPLPEHPELFQALTPPPPPAVGRVPKFRKGSYQQNFDRVAMAASLVSSHPSIQITSVQTLAPLTSGRESDQPLPKFFSERDAAIAQRGLAALKGTQNDVFNPQKLRQSAPVTNGPTVTNGPPVERAAIMNMTRPPALVDLSRTRNTIMANARLAEAISGLKSPQSNHNYHPEGRENLMMRHREGEVMKDVLIKYDPEEQQQHFLEIKRHLLASNPNPPAEEIVHRGYDVGAHPRHVVPGHPRLEDHGHISTTHLHPDQGLSKMPSPLGRFSGAMMEHVRHWKAQNDQKQPSPQMCSPDEVPSRRDSLAHQRIVPPVPQGSMVPMNLSPNQSHHPSPSPSVPKSDKNMPLLPNGDVNSALLENLQAIHKMYFKTLQSDEKVLFPKIPPNEATSMSQKVVPIVGSPISNTVHPPHLMPRYPPERHIPPEMLNPHMNSIARNIPPMTQLSPPSHNIMQPSLIPIRFAPQDQLRFQVPRVPQPFRSDGVVMVPVQPGMAPLPPHILSQPSHPQISPREMLKPQLPVSPKTLQGLLVRMRAPRFYTDKPAGQAEPIEIQRAVEAASAYAKRKASESVPVDLSTKAAKVPRYSEGETVIDSDQPIDLSVKSKPARVMEQTFAQPPDVHQIGRHIILPEYHRPNQPMRMLASPSAETPTSEHLPPRGIPRHYLLPPNQLLPQHLVNHNFNGVPLRMRAVVPVSSERQPLLSPTSPQQRMPVLDPQHQIRMPTPEQLEMMRMIIARNGQVVPSSLYPSPVKASPAALPPHLIQNSVRQMDSDNSCLRKKRGRPRGSTNKRRYQNPPPVPSSLQIVETRPVVSPTVSSSAVSLCADTIECQFCDFKAASRGDVRQHVKAVHFAKFRRDSNKSGGGDALTPMSEYTVQMVDPSDSENVQTGAGSSGRGVMGPDSTRPQGMDGYLGSPSSNSDSDGSRLVIDTSLDMQQKIKEELPSPAGAPPDSQTLSRPPDSSSYDHGTLREKTPLKLTLRRVSSSGGDTPPVFSPLPPQDTSPPPAQKKPKFACRTCGASYNYVNGLREHESRHRVDLPFECGVCHLKYKTMGMLSRHQAQKNHQI